MLIIVLLLIIIAISLNYFNHNALESTIHQSAVGRLSNHSNLSLNEDSDNINDEMSFNSSITTIWKRMIIILLICTLPLLWEGRIYENVYLYNGLLLLTNKLNLVVWLLFIIGISLISIIGKQDNFTDNSNNMERIVFTLCAILGGIILNYADDFLTILAGLELQSYSVYILAASYRNYEPSEAAGLKYFLLGALSSALVFMGLAILYTYSGNTNLDTTFLMISSFTNSQSYINNYTLTENNIILPFAGIILLVAGISWKVAAAPVQAWSIDVYDAVPTRTTAILSLLPKIALFSLFIRLIYMLTSNSNNTIFDVYNINLHIISLIIILSLTGGAVAGLFQPRIKRLLAYSSVLNVGFILMGALLSNSILDYFNPTLYIIQYIVTTTAIWLCLVNISNFNNSEVTLTSQIQCIHSSSNNNTTVIAICLTALILSTAGIPPMVGFFAKYSIILLAIQSGYTSIALIAVLASIISTVYYLGVIKTIWTTSPLTNSNLFIASMHNQLNNKTESTLFIAFYSLIVVLYLLQSSVIYTLLSL